MDNTQSEAMKKAQELIKQKDDIEAEIRKAQEELQSQKVGMNEKLVDNNGFPRSDIDLVLVTTARSNIVRLKNDHKAIMDKIEEALHAVHAEALAEKQRSSNMANTQSASTSVADKRTGTKQDSNEESLIPFARVNAVAPDSPAKDA
ncbi:26S proteasome non-ATPase regulatory subunit 9, partial [Lobosporangium transversale]